MSLSIDRSLLSGCCQTAKPSAHRMLGWGGRPRGAVHQGCGELGPETIGTAFSPRMVAASSSGTGHARSAGARSPGARAAAHAMFRSTTHRAIARLSWSPSRLGRSCASRSLAVRSDLRPAGERGALSPDGFKFRDVDPSSRYSAIQPPNESGSIFRSSSRRVLSTCRSESNEPTRRASCSQCSMSTDRMTRLMSGI